MTVSRIALLGAFLLAAAPAMAQAQAMSVATFLAKGESLKKKGPLALMSGDLKLLGKQIQADAASLRSEREAARSAGRTPAYCPPESGARMGQNEIAEAMQAVPVAERARTSTKDALRSYFARRFPCGG